MNTVHDHNAEPWIVVRYLQPRDDAFACGWYVVRTCPCHWNMRVTEPRESEAAAIRAKAAMLKVSKDIEAEKALTR